MEIAKYIFQKYFTEKFRRKCQNANSLCWVVVFANVKFFKYNFIPPNFLCQVPMMFVVRKQNDHKYGAKSAR